MTVRDHAAATTLALASVLVVLDEAPAPSASATREPETELAPIFAGCAATQRGGVCEIDPARPSLTLWLDSANPKKAEARCGDVVVPIVARPLDGGEQLTLGLAEVALPCELTLIRQGDARTPIAKWRRSLKAAEKHPALTEADRLRRAGRLDEAKKALGDANALPETWHGRRTSLEGRLALAAGRTDEALVLLRDAILAHRRDGRTSDEALDTLVVGYMLLKQSRFTEARSAFDEADKALADYDEGRPHASYYRALLSRDTGAVRTALRELETSARGSERLGLSGLRDDVRQVTGFLLQSLGRTREASRVVEELSRDLAVEADACKRASYASSIATILLMLGEQTEAGDRAGEARELIARALEDHRRCPRAVLEQTALVNLAWAALQDNALEAVEEAAVEAVRRGAEQQPHLGMWLIDIRGRAALAGGKPARALEHFDRLAALAGSAGTPEAAWRAATGRGEALQALGRHDAAIESYERAETLLGELTAGVPLSGGRSSFLGGRERSARRLVQLLIDRKRPADALGAARRARTRALASSRRLDRLEHLTAADRVRWDAALVRHHDTSAAAAELSSTAWKLLASELPEREAQVASQQRAAREALEDALGVLGEAAAQRDAPAGRDPGEVVLAFHPASGGRYWGFIEDDRGVRALELTLPVATSHRDAWAKAVIAPFAEGLRAATSVRVLSYGKLNEVDVHALDLDGQPLIASRPVTYSVDLPGTPDSGSSGHRGLVVADPSSDLRHALHEGKSVAESLSSSWTLTRFEQSAARRNDVLAALSGVDLLHFAGHGVFEGVAGWESRLELADAPLTLGDVLALSRAPRWVVLSSCSTARVDTESSGVDLGLSHAFLFSGTTTVLAATRNVPDALGRDLASALYRNVSDESWSLRTAAANALAQIARSSPDLDWAAYRIVTR
ncbi:MAG: CHAT domain-containing protein [Polyangiaceae bacterium]|nr:CHAT domain-containing protein [Polyangiaceae bacterium]